MELKAINFAFEEAFSFNNQLRRKLGNIDNKSDDPKWVKTLKAFKHNAKAYNVKYDRPMAIVYDNVSRLDSETIIFVSSVGSVPKIMETNQSIEIGDLTKEEYLVNKCKIKEETANSLYELVGGRFIDLMFVADEFLAVHAFKTDEVLEKNVFAYHLRKNIVIFQSKSVELYIKIEADEFDVK
ncbi:16079_t:CDS:2 [Funneliformis geosporum]|nr:16079_t:CDS:2 [Funneliformis geosporum]